MSVTPHHPNTGDAAAIRFGRTAPGIPVRDVEAALHFYRDALGMTVTFTNGDPLEFVVLERWRHGIRRGRITSPTSW